MRSIPVKWTRSPASDQLHVGRAGVLEVVALVSERLGLMVMVTVTVTVRVGRKGCRAKCEGSPTVSIHLTTSSSARWRVAMPLMNARLRVTRMTQFCPLPPGNSSPWYINSPTPITVHHNQTLSTPPTPTPPRHLSSSCTHTTHNPDLTQPFNPGH